MGQTEFLYNLSIIIDLKVKICYNKVSEEAYDYESGTHKQNSCE